MMLTTIRELTSSHTLLRLTDETMTKMEQPSKKAAKNRIFSAKSAPTKQQNANIIITRFIPIRLAQSPEIPVTVISKF